MGKKHSASNVVKRLKAFNKGRDPQMIQLKYHKMRTNAFAFLRGTCHLFYEDWPSDSALNDAPAVWLCGDMHPENFGSYKGGNRLVYFDVNDFDESLLSPCTWDAARLVCALFVSASLIDLGKSDASALADLFLKTYSHCLAEGTIRSIERDNATGLVRDLLDSLKARTEKVFLDVQTQHVDGQRRFILDSQHYLEVSSAVRSRVSKKIEGLGEYKGVKDFFKVLDVAWRVAGTGSLGLERFAILIEGNGSPDGNFILDLKEERTSALAPYAPVRQPKWSSQAGRVVAVQKQFQSMPPAMLSAIKMGQKAYVLRELQPFEDKVALTAWNGKRQRLEELVETQAQILAWGHLRGSGWQHAATADDLISFGASSDWQTALSHYAHKYAAQVEDDFNQFAEAYDKDKFAKADDAN